MDATTRHLEELAAIGYREATLGACIRLIEERDEARAERDEWNERADLNAGELAHAERLRDEARADLTRATEAIYTAEAFIVTVQKWNGSPDDRTDTLDEIRHALDALTDQEQER